MGLLGQEAGPLFARPSSFQDLVRSTSFLTCLLVLTFVFLKSVEHTNQPRPEESSFTRSRSYLAPLVLVIAPQITPKLMTDFEDTLLLAH